MSSNLPLSEQVKIVDGTRQTELDAQRAQILSDMDQRQRARQERRHLLIDMGADSASAELPTIQALSRHERKNYSVARLISNLADRARSQGTPAKAKGEACLESEISASISADLKMVPPHGGSWLPLRINAAGLDSKTNSSGAYTVGEKVRNIEDALRQHTLVLTLGARLLTGLRFNAIFPIENAIMAATWVSENPGSDVADSDSTFKAAIITGHGLAATTSVSRQLIAQSTPDIEMWIKSRIGLAHGLALDRAAIHGSGLSNEPIGLLKTTGIGDVAIGAAGGSPTSDFINSLEAAVAAANADSQSCGFLTNSIMRSRLRKLPSMASGTLPLWSELNRMLGYRSEVSNQLKSDLVKGGSSDCSPSIFGDWSQLILGEFQGALEICVDEFSAKRRGMVELTSWGLYDVLAIQPSAFAAILDARNV